MYKIKRKPFLITKEIDNESVIFDTRLNKKVYKLNETASFIWSECEKEIDFNELIESFCDSYDLPDDEAKKEISDFINDLIEQNLLEKV